MFVQAGCPDNGRPAGDPLSPEEIAVLQPQLETCRVTSQQFDWRKEALHIPFTILPKVSRAVPLGIYSHFMLKIQLFLRMVRNGFQPKCWCSRSYFIKFEKWFVWPSMSHEQQRHCQPSLVPFHVNKKFASLRPQHKDCTWIWAFTMYTINEKKIHFRFAWFALDQRRFSRVPEMAWISEWRINETFGGWRTQGR